MRISAENISHTYHSRTGSNQVLQEVSLGIGPGETVGLLGSSGCGKSTLGQILCGLLRPASGRVCYDGSPVAFPYTGTVRREIQILFQHPELSFNPRLKLRSSLKEVYNLYRLPYSERDMLEMLSSFGIYAEHLDRFPAQLSGGELQRLALARVLLVEPKVIILDEPTSMLDAISQAQIARMLMDIQKKTGMSYLFITHNRSLCELVSNRILVIEKGRIQKGEKTCQKESLHCCSSP